MKETGVEWIGKIPEEWKITKLKYLSKENLQYGANTEGIEFSEELPRYIRITDITSKNTLKDEGKLSLPDDIAKSYILKDGDILFARSGATVGKTFIFEGNMEKSAFAGYLIKLQPCLDKVVPKFIYYYTLGTGYENWKDSIFSQSTIQNIGADKYGNMFLAIPEIEEQKNIVNFLDGKIGKIDRIIELLEKKLEKIEEYKKSIITELVTKGLDSNVERKNSNIEWIGEIPINWNLSKFKYEVSTPITDGPHETPNLYDEGIPFASAESVKNGIIDLRYIRGFISESDHKIFSKKVLPRKEDIFIVKSGAGTGRSGIVTTDDVFNIWSPLALIRSNNKFHEQRFFYYFTLSNSFIKQVEQGWSYGTQQNIGMRVLENLYIALPTKEEQCNIVEKLDSKTETINSIIDNIHNELLILKKMKKALIFEYVTGKKRVF